MAHNPRKEKPVKKELLTIRLTEDLRKALDALAQADDRSVSYVAHKLLEEAVARQKGGK